MQIPVPGDEQREGRPCTNMSHKASHVHQHAVEHHGVPPVPVPLPAHSRLLHTHACTPAEDSTCTHIGVGLCLPLLGTYTYTGHRHLPRQPYKATCPVPREHSGPCTAWPRPSRSLGPVPPGHFLQCRKPHCSRSQRCLHPPPLARGSAAPHTCKGPQYCLCPTRHPGQRAWQRA